MIPSSAAARTRAAADAAAGSRASARAEPKRSRMPSIAASSRESLRGPGREQVRPAAAARRSPVPTPSNRNAAFGWPASQRRASAVRAPRHGGGVLRRRLEHALAGVGLEIRAPDLHRDAAGGEVMGAQARGRAVGERRQAPLELAGVANVRCECLLRADGFLLAIGARPAARRCRAPAPAWRLPCLPKARHRRLLARARDIADGLDARRLHGRAAISRPTPNSR